MLSEKLKEETKHNHQVLEKELVRKLKAIRSEKEYAALLKLFYGYFGGLEAKIENIIDKNLLPDNAERRKTKAIANDLLYLESNVPDTANGSALPRINTHLHALGALYVIEGSTLGGKIISKMMQQQLNLGDGGISFFAGYGEQTQQMWDDFKNALNTQVKQSTDEAEVITAANETFLKFGEWLKGDN